MRTPAELQEAARLMSRTQEAMERQGEPAKALIANKVREALDWALGRPTGFGQYLEHARTVESLRGAAPPQEEMDAMQTCLDEEGRF